MINSINGADDLDRLRHQVQQLSLAHRLAVGEQLTSDSVTPSFLSDKTHVVIGSQAATFLAQDGAVGPAANTVQDVSPADPQQNYVPSAILCQTATTRGYIGPELVQPDQTHAQTDPGLYCARVFEYVTTKSALDEQIESYPDDIANFPMPPNYTGYLLMLKLRVDPQSMPWFWPFHLGRRKIIRGEAQYLADHLNRRIARIALAHDQASQEGDPGRVTDRMGGLLVEDAEDYFGDSLAGLDLDPYLPGVVLSGEDLALRACDWSEIRELIAQPHHMLCFQLDRLYPSSDPRWHMVRGGIDALCFLRSLLDHSVPEYRYKAFLKCIAQVPFASVDQTTQDVKELLKSLCIEHMLEEEISH